MRNKNISFGQVLRNKNKKQQTPLIQSKMKLSDILMKWEMNPRQNFTLSYAMSSLNSNSQAVGTSSLQRKGGQFDSFIQKQALGQINNNFYRNKHQTSKVQQNPKWQKQILKLPPTEIEMIHSKKYGDQSISQSYSRRYDSIKESSENNHLAANKPTSDKLQRSKTSYLKQNQKTPATKKKNNKQFQKIIDSTDNIHEDIAQLAHKYVLEKKKQSQMEEQLLLSLEDQEKLVNNKKNSRQEIQNRLKEQAKQQINIFIKRNEVQNTVPTFGGQKYAEKQTMKSKQQKQDQHVKLQIKEVTKNVVGYSFATSLPDEQKNQSQAIPSLQLNERAPTIPLIQQISSERQYSECNQQIQNMYSKWHKQQPINISHQNIQNIQSMCFHKVPQQQIPIFHSGGKKVSKQQKEVQQFNKSQITNKDVCIQQPDRQGQSYADVLCLSKTQKKQDVMKSDAQLGPLSSPSSSSTVRPQRDIYLSNQQPEFPQNIEQQQKNVQTCQFQAPKAQEKQIQQTSQYEIKEQKKRLEPKQSPKQYFHNYGLNKVYSNAKANQKNNKPEQVQTSDFNSARQIKQSGTKNTINGSNKNKGICKIQSIANTSIFTACARPQTKKNNQEEQFTFDL